MKQNMEADMTEAKIQLFTSADGVITLDSVWLSQAHVFYFGTHGQKVRQIKKN